MGSWVRTCLWSRGGSSRSVELAPREVQSCAEAILSCSVGLVLLAHRLVLVQLALELVKVALGDAKLVLQRGDHLVLSEKLLLEVLVLGGELVGTLTCASASTRSEFEFLWSNEGGERFVVFEMSARCPRF